jgi:hypothetical protein
VVVVLVVAAELWRIVTAGCGVMTMTRMMSSWLGRRWLQQLLQQQRQAGSGGGAW